MSLTYASVCSGIEAASVAWHPLGWRGAFVSEIEPFPCAVLAHHWPQIPNYGDITKFKDWPPPRGAINVLVGGTPCQSFSVAGLRKGMDDPRGNLALVFLGVVDRFRPTWVLWENVPGVHSSWSDETAGAPSKESSRLLRADGLEPGDFEEVEQSSDFDCFMSGLEQLGYGVACTVLDAQFFGVAQRRERVFVVGHIGGQWQRAAAVLFDQSCLCGDHAPSREAGQGTAPTISARTKGGGGLGTDAECDGAVIPVQGGGQTQAMRMLSFGEYSDDGTASSLKRRDFKDATDLVIQRQGGSFDDAVAGAISKESFTGGAGGRPDGAAQNHFLPVAFKPSHFTRGKDGAPNEITPPLSADADKGDQDTVVATAYRTAGNCGPFEQGDKTAALNTATDPNQNIITLAIRGRGGYSNLETRQDGTANAILTTNGGRGGIGVGAIAFQPRYFTRDNKTGNAASCGDKSAALSADHGGGDSAPCVAYTLHGSDKTVSVATETDVAGSIRTKPPGSIENSSTTAVLSGYAVRRLTPRECERLQGFPDDYTLIQFHNKPACDGPRYRALGNSMAVPVMRWIGERIQLVESILPL
ncbi:MAG: DNA (cytosine-5-)-methyltransferase [Bryobacteraceae bacterium]